MQQKNKVIFFQVKDPKSKLIKIIQTAYKHFENKKHLLIKTSDEASSRFVDELLWSHPVDSFLPHVVSDSKVDDFIVISNNTNNVNNFHYLFNLTQDLLDIDKKYKVIYDFDDYTSPLKLSKSKEKFELYKSLGYQIESQ
ncbi:MAG: DNA polymerase III subunit chi [Parachlamydiales bacterium]|nr:DNA polymerase III subunit chi [Parachlamydiales bacterium]